MLQVLQTGEDLLYFSELELHEGDSSHGCGMEMEGDGGRWREMEGDGGE